MAERTAHTRHALPFATAMAVGLLSFVAVPLLPGAYLMTGSLTPGEVSLVVLPGLLFILVATLLYRRLGAEHPAYVVAEALEMASLYSTVVVMPVIGSGVTTLMWTQVPGAVFWAMVKPGFAVRYGAIICAVNLAAIGVLAARDRSDDAALAALVGALSMLAFVVTARVRRRTLRAEAERDVLRARVAEARLDQARRRTEHELTQNVGCQLEALAAVLERHGRDETIEVRRMAEMVSDIVFPLDHPVSIDELAQLIAARCRALCRSSTFGFDVGATVGPLGAPSARALLRICQELVRNAVTHGMAAQVRVELLAIGGGPLRLSVSDDGVGLTVSSFSTATGGLRNARAWSEEVGGLLTLEARAGWSTTLTASLP